MADFLKADLNHYTLIIMEIHPIELVFAQEFLAKLIQILTPLVKSNASSGEKDKEVLFFEKLFIPPILEEKNAHFDHEVRLLTILHQAQKQMGHWIEKLDVETRSSKDEPSFKKEEEIKLKLQSFKEESSCSSRRSETARNPLQVQRVIAQVRNAIQSLPTSISAEDVKIVPFRDAVKKLKPLIDELIESVSRGEMPSSDESPYQKPIAILKKLEPPIDKKIPKPDSNWTETRLQNKTHKPHSIVKDEPENEKKAEKKRTFPSPLKNNERSEPKIGSLRSPLPIKPQSAVYFAQPLAPAFQENEAEQESISLKIAPNSAPFLPQAQTSSPLKKKKKKRGLWTRNQREEDSEERLLP